MYMVTKIIDLTSLALVEHKDIEVCQGDYAMISSQ
jgi:hypothetical protein